MDTASAYTFKGFTFESSFLSFFCKMLANALLMSNACLLLMSFIFIFYADFWLC